MAYRFGVSKEVGKKGEKIGVRYLRENKYEIKAVNYRCRFGEIDIIAADKNFICFVEVKTRSQNALAAPKESVNLQKQRRIIQTALQYLSLYPSQLQPRFDVLELIYFEQSHKINFIKNAFDATDINIY